MKYRLVLTALAGVLCAACYVCLIVLWIDAAAQRPWAVVLRTLLAGAMLFAAYELLESAAAQIRTNLKKRNPAFVFLQGIAVSALMVFFL